MVSKPYKKAYSRVASPRAWTESKLVLVPPEVWKLGRRDRRTVRELLRRAPDPESAGVVINLVAAVSQKLGERLSINAVPKGRLSKEETQAWYRRMAERKAASAVSGSASEIIPPLSEVGGYRSSVHSTAAETPKLVSDDELLTTGKSGDPVWMERERDKARLRGQREATEKAKSKTWIDQWSERMQARLKKPEKGD